jgi:hypothetical protein
MQNTYLDDPVKYCLLIQHRQYQIDTFDYTQVMKQAKVFPNQYNLELKIYF